jgi:hypothetical protein
LQASCVSDIYPQEISETSRTVHETADFLPGHIQKGYLLVRHQARETVASKDRGPCEGIIYTLKPGQDGVQALNNLFAWRKGEEGLESNYESVTAIPYIDVGTRLDEAQAEPVNLEPATQVIPQPAQTPKTTPQQTTPEIYRQL